MLLAKMLCEVFQSFQNQTCLPFGAAIVDKYVVPPIFRVKKGNSVFTYSNSVKFHDPNSVKFHEIKFQNYRKLCNTCQFIG